MKFKSKPSLRIMGLYAILVFIGIPLGLAMLGLFDRTPVRQSDVLAYTVLCLVSMILGMVSFYKVILEKCFATLVVSATGVCWKCPLRRTIIMTYSECNYVGVQAEKTNGTTAYSFIYLSTDPYPSEYIGRINKIPVQKGFIKFIYNEELFNILSQMKAEDSSK